MREALASGREVYGLFVSVPSPTMVEMVAAAGFDFAILDTEHTLVDPQTLMHMIRAAEAFGIAPLVRVPEDDPGAIGRVLDAGAHGVVVPHVRGPLDARRAVRAARYAPEGMRSLAGGRIAGYGRVDLGNYVANARPLVVPMIEDAEAVAGIDAILAEPGIDLVLEGAADLSQSLGVTWQTRHPDVVVAVRATAAACARAGVPFCAIPRVPADHRAWRDAGVRAFVLGEDQGLTARALRAHLAHHREPGPEDADA
ncbi:MULTISPECIES: HpcH/HpaI aldolase/citrate lyase family protein [unclassified Pseudonocardia]|uniref:HpcH/HpaI aldolase family protein n=1 Tax=unclassified Pseudonocardia TaxID=2619320 RepID=UPI000A6D8DDD|nr:MULTISPECIES: aldolase/citrate lyase family protein [unclassified Pseudonocardia]